MGNFEHLLSPITIAGKVYKNRITAAPFHAQKIRDNGEMQEYETNLRIFSSAGGVASVCLGDLSVDKKYENFAETPDFNDFHSPAAGSYAKVAKIIKDNGALALAQLGHPGAKRFFNRGWETVGPVTCTREDGMRIIGMNEKHMLRACERFAIAAYWFKQLGYDGVLVHAGHGYLLDQFLSPHYNTRIDEYGGSIENRSRFPVRVIKAVREKVGKDFIIEVRISGDENIEDGLKVEDAAVFCKMLEGITDIIHVSAGLNIFNTCWKTHLYSSMYDPHFCNLQLAEYIKKRVHIPISVVGGINSPEEAEHYIAEGKIDFISLGRQMFADPNFANKTMNGNADDIARCIRCGVCNGNGSPSPNFFPLIPNDRPRCTINPLFGRSIPPEGFPNPAASKNVLVIGGGPAGMQAAITAADQGHNVTLVEKTDRLGGIINLTDTDLHKTDLKNFKNLLINRIAKRNIDVLMNTEVDEELINTLSPVSIIAAVGASPIVPDIPGVEKAVPVLDVFRGAELGEKVVVIGGGLAGCDTAVHLADLGKKVKIVEMLDDLAPAGTNGYKVFTLEQFERKGITYDLYMKCTTITDKGVEAQDVTDCSNHFFEADTVIMALGMRPNTAVVEALKTTAGDIQFRAVGDCVRAATVQEAIYTGFSAAIEIQ